MTTEAKNVKFRRQMAATEASKRATDPAKKMKPRERIRVRLRCRICGRARAVYRKFGICRICFRDMANNGLIPGVKKASW
jgi:ribosomal protein S14